LNESKKIPEFGSKIETSDDQIKALNEKINKLVEESENKSKTIRQYILRDNASKLMPDDRTLNKVYNLLIIGI
jgi:vacuolar-type H+-ATPase subunit I/STV1